MIITRLNVVLAVLLFIVVCLIVSLDADRSQPNYEFLPNMKRTGASSAFSANVVFPNGRTMQASVAGTIARGDLPIYYAPTKEDAIRAGEELLNPYLSASGAASALRYNDRTILDSSATVVANTTADNASVAAPEAAAKSDPAALLQASVQRGAEVYNVYCISCHGVTGTGDGPVAKRGFPPPPPLPTGKSVQMKDGQLFHILTYGQGSMSSMAAQLTRDRRWDVINFVRRLQQNAPPQASTEPSAFAIPTEPEAPETAPSDAEESKP
ncbi:MAG: cytochrome c [Planctomycetota bacterium]|nr:cytochrome c [Planctomycetota bacterium]